MNVKTSIENELDHTLERMTAVLMDGFETLEILRKSQSNFKDYIPLQCLTHSVLQIARLCKYYKETCQPMSGDDFDCTLRSMESRISAINFNNTVFINEFKTSKYETASI